MASRKQGHHESHPAHCGPGPVHRRNSRLWPAPRPPRRCPQRGRQPWLPARSKVTATIPSVTVRSGSRSIRRPTRSTSPTASATRGYYLRFLSEDRDGWHYPLALSLARWESARRHDRMCRRTAVTDVYASGSARSSVEAGIGGPPTRGGRLSGARIAADMRASGRPGAGPAVAPEPGIMRTRAAGTQNWQIDLGARATTSQTADHLRRRSAPPAKLGGSSGTVALRNRR